MFRQIMVALLFVTLLFPTLATQAGVRSKALQETLEFVGRRFGKEVVEEGAERLSVRMTRLAAKHGDDVVASAFKRVGPRAGKIADEAAEHGDVALKLMARHGDDALPLVTKAASLRAVSQYGDDAATALLKHGPVGEKLVERFAKEGAEALARITPQNGRRLAMLSAEGVLKPELLKVVRQYGDEACEFIWHNKGALATGALLATFVASPEPYLQGVQTLTTTVAEAAVKPLADVPQAVAAEAAANTNWNFLWLLLAVLAGVAGWRFLRAGRLLADASGSPGLGRGFVPQQNGAPREPAE